MGRFLCPSGCRCSCGDESDISNLDLDPYVQKAIGLSDLYVVGEGAPISSRMFGNEHSLTGGVISTKRALSLLKWKIGTKRCSSCRKQQKPMGEHLIAHLNTCPLSKHQERSGTGIKYGAALKGSCPYRVHIAYMLDPAVHR